jgi:hypothetical protein
LKRAVIHRYDGNTGSMSVASNGVRGSDSNPQFGTVFRFGSNAGNVTGLQVGGGDPIHGNDGMVQFIDGYAGWMTSQPSKYQARLKWRYSQQHAPGDAQRYPEQTPLR